MRPHLFGALILLRILIKPESLRGPKTKKGLFTVRSPQIIKKGQQFSIIFFFWATLFDHFVMNDNISARILLFKP